MATHQKKIAVKTAPPRRAPSTTQLADSGAFVERREPPEIVLQGRASPAGEKVTVIVPKAFTLTRDDRAEIPFAAGVQEMYVEDAEHWYSQANGVAEYKPR